MSLADELLAREPVGGARLLYGVVTDDSPLTVKVGASSTGQAAKALAGYTPAVDDYVAVLVQGADRLVVGAVAAPRESSGTWTPDYTFGGAARTPGSPSGAWYRSGRLVVVSWSMTAQSTESGSEVRVTGLPVAPDSGVPGQFGRGRVSTTLHVDVIVDATAGNLLLRTDSGGAPALTASAPIAGSVVYWTD